MQFGVGLVGVGISSTYQFLALSPVCVSHFLSIPHIVHPLTRKDGRGGTVGVVPL